MYVLFLAIVTITVVSLTTAQDAIEAIHSDFLTLYTANTSLPFPMGIGVFTRFDTPANELLCEYRGPAIGVDVDYQSDKKFLTSTPDGQQHNIIADGICGYINDCAWILESNYTREDIDRFKASDDETVIPTYPGYRYNARFEKTRLGKILLYAAEEIPANSEIFYPYGR